MVLREVSSFPTSELTRILNKSELSRVINLNNRGSIKDAWKTFEKALEKNDKEQIPKSLSKLIIMYSLVVGFLSQPENKRLSWIRNFLTTSAQKEINEEMVKKVFSDKTKIKKENIRKQLVNLKKKSLDKKQQMLNTKPDKTPYEVKLNKLEKKSIQLANNPNVDPFVKQNQLRNIQIQQMSNARKQQQTLYRNQVISKTQPQPQQIGESFKDYLKTPLE